MNIIERIRAEMKRQIHMLRSSIQSQGDYGQSCQIVAYENLLSFLDTLEEPVSENLEEAAMNYIAPIENDEGLDYINFNGQDIKDAFIAGSEWRYQKDRAEFAKLKTKEWMSGYDEGLSKGKEQMMKEAVEGVVCYGSKGAYIETDFLGEYDTDVYGNPGDKVKIIIVKEDGQ